MQLTSKHIIRSMNLALFWRSLVASGLVAWVGALAYAQDSGFRLVEGSGSSPFAVAQTTLSYVDARGTATKPTIAFHETLRGNGSRSGYSLSHGGVVPGTVSIMGGVGRMRANVDFFLDAANGSIYFADAIRPGTALDVSYRYVEGMDASRSGMALGSLKMNMLGGQMSLNFGLNKSASGMDFTSYGMNFSGKVGSASHKGLYYISTPSENVGNLVHALPNGPKSNAFKASEAQKGHLLFDEAAFQNKGLKISGSIMDVSKTFNGFQSLKQANSGDAATLAQITAMEKEKGLRRESLSLGLTPGKTSALGLAWDRVEDGKSSIERKAMTLQSGALKLGYKSRLANSGFTRFADLRESDGAEIGKEKGMKRESLSLGFQPSKTKSLSFQWDKVGQAGVGIDRQAMSFASGALKVDYTARKVDQKFTRFADLKDDDRAQLARETGMSRKEMGLAYAPNKTQNFQFARRSFTDQSGTLSNDSLRLDSRGWALGFNQTVSALKFSRLNDLSDADKNVLALEIRRQYNPNAAVGEVTPADRAQIAGSAGLTRRNTFLAGQLSKTTGLKLQDVSIVGDQSSVHRVTLALTNKKWQFTALDQSISSNFTRLTGLSDFEKTQLGNEYGMRRTQTAFAAELPKGSRLTLSDLRLRASTGDMIRSGLTYATKNTDIKVNLASTAANWNRTADIVGFNPAEKALIDQERGYTRWDYVAAMAPRKGLSITSMMMDAANSLMSLKKSSYKHTLLYQPRSVTKLAFQWDDVSSGPSGKMDGTNHILANYDDVFKKTMKFTAGFDRVTTMLGGSISQQVTTATTHLESDKAKPTNLVFDGKHIDLDKGRFESTAILAANVKASKTLNLKLDKITIDRGAEPSTDTNQLSWAYQWSKLISVAGYVAHTSTNNDTNGIAKSMALTTPISRHLQMTGTYTELNRKGTGVKAISDIALASSKPTRILGMKEVNWTFRYAGLNDLTRELNQNVGGKISGLMGKHQLAMEYNGLLDAAKAQRGVSRMASFISDRNAKLPYHFDLLYKARNIQQGNLVLVRKYNADVSIARKLKMLYAYLSLPEDAAGNPQPTKSTTFALSQTLDSKNSLTVNYTENEQLAQNTHVEKLGATFNSAPDKNDAVEVGYSIDVSTIAGQIRNAHTVHLGYNYKLNQDQSLSLGGSYTMGQTTETETVRANFEFRTRF